MRKKKHKNKTPRVLKKVLNKYYIYILKQKLPMPSIIHVKVLRRYDRSKVVIQQVNSTQIVFYNNSMNKHKIDINIAVPKAKLKERKKPLKFINDLMVFSNLP